MWKTVRRWALEAGALALIAGIGALISWKWHSVQVQEEAPKPGEATVGMVQMWGSSSVVWVDARTRDRFQQRHIPTAVLLNEEEWDQLLPEFFDRWEPERVIVVYAEGAGDRAITIAHRLREEAKIANVYTLKGGIEKWRVK